MVAKSGEAHCAPKVALLGDIDDADYCVGNMAFAGRARVWAVFSVLGDLGFLEALEKVVFFSEAVHVWALPMGSRECSVVFAAFGNLDSAIFPGELGFDFFLTFGADAFRLRHARYPPMSFERASRINASGNRIMDIVINRSYFRTFATVGSEATSRIEE